MTPNREQAVGMSHCPDEHFKISHCVVSGCGTLAAAIAKGALARPQRVVSAGELHAAPAQLLALPDDIPAYFGGGKLSFNPWVAHGGGVMPIGFNESVPSRQTP